MRCGGLVTAGGTEIPCWFQWASYFPIQKPWLSPRYPDPSEIQTLHHSEFRPSPKIPMDRWIKTCATVLACRAKASPELFTVSWGSHLGGPHLGGPWRISSNVLKIEILCQTVVTDINNMLQHATCYNYSRILDMLEYLRQRSMESFTNIVIQK